MTERDFIASSPDGGDHMVSRYLVALDINMDGAHEYLTKFPVEATLNWFQTKTVGSTTTSTTGKTGIIFVEKHNTSDISGRVQEMQKR